MKFDFSSQFLRVVPPDTSFSEAWESLCYFLLACEFEHSGLIRLKPPDKGIDILYQPENRAYQCKSTQLGAQGSLNATESLKSLTTAMKHKEPLKWDVYCFATNANYTGSALEKLLSQVQKLGLSEKSVEFFGPEYWNNLCEKYEDQILDRFDYRITTKIGQISEAFQKAQYYDKYIKEFIEKIHQANFTLVLTNNRTPVKIEVPFSPELSVENFLDVAKELLNIPLEWTNYPDLGTSAGLSLSISIDRLAQPFDKNIGELPVKSGEELQLWIQIVWKDKVQEEARNVDTKYASMVSSPFHYELLLNEGSLRELTISRQEELVQTIIWESIHSSMFQ
ncbi:MAG: hypothetical protein JW712_02690 [Dehalococcoidales bacterium]|nr:hypothetical protein [Dehalococcoidales bacterium]